LARVRELRESLPVHYCVVERICGGKRGWDMLACVVDYMRIAYSRVKKVGLEKALKELGCGDLIEGGGGD